MPVRRAVEPAVLRPGSVGLLRRPQIAQDAPHLRIPAAGQKRSAGLAEVARPDQMVAAEVVVALAEAPGNRQARDDAARERRRLVAAQDGRADAIEVVAARAPFERAQAGLPRAPAGGVIVEDRLERRLKRGQGVVGRLGRRPAEAEGENRRAVRALRQLGRQRDVAVGRRVVLLGQPAIARKLLPAVGDADEADRAGEERLIGGQGQIGSAAVGEQHAVALVVAAPAAVVGAAVDEMRRQQREQAQAAAAKLFEPDLHQHRAAARVGDDALDDAEAAAAMRARQAESRERRPRATPPPTSQSRFSSAKKPRRR